MINQSLKFLSFRNILPFNHFCVTIIFVTLIIIVRFQSHCVFTNSQLVDKGIITEYVIIFELRSTTALEIFFIKHQLNFVFNIHLFSQHFKCWLMFSSKIAFNFLVKYPSTTVSSHIDQKTPTQIQSINFHLNHLSGAFKVSLITIFFAGEHAGSFSLE